MTYDIRQPYESNLYVGRERELGLTLEWWESKKRLLSVTAPPATGKTWFLRRVEQQFLAQEIVAFWLDVKDLLLLPKESIAKSRKLNPGRVNEWLKKFVVDINQVCAGELEEFTIETIEQLARTIEQLAIEISKLCQSKQGICIFIDDGDQFDDGGWSEFERKILEPFAGDGHRFAHVGQFDKIALDKLPTCPMLFGSDDDHSPFATQETLRFVIAVREKRSVQTTFALRISENPIKLEPLTRSLGEQQIKQLREQKSATSSQIIEDFLDILQIRDYGFIHPGLNNFVCLFAEDKPQAISNFNVADIFSSALEAVYPQSKDDINSLVALLYRLSMLANEWDIEDLVEQFQVSRPQAWDYIQVLKEYSLIKQNLNRYEIIVGIREFVRAILTGENFYAVMPGVVIDLPDDFHYSMDKRFIVEELKEICFNLGIDNENALLGETKLSKVIALIQYCRHRDRLPDLIAQCQRLRPNVNWLQ